MLSNGVTRQFIADVLLAAGARPVMAFDSSEVVEIASQADALCINTGTPHPLIIPSYKLALQEALRRSIPVALDFPGVPASSIRRETAAGLLSILGDRSSEAPVLIRGNASEILCLAEGYSCGGAIDSIHTPAEASVKARILLNAVDAVCISGSENIVLGGSEKRENHIPGGTELMARSSGFGCISTALMSAFLAVSHELSLPPDASVAAVSVCRMMLDASSSILNDSSPGPAEFKSLFIDKLYEISTKNHRTEKNKFKSPDPNQAGGRRVMQ